MNISTSNLSSKSKLSISSAHRSSNPSLKHSLSTTNTNGNHTNGFDESPSLNSFNNNTSPAKEDLPKAYGSGSDEKKGKSKKFLNQWKQAASMSKIGNRTKNLLEKWKYSYSVDVNESSLCPGVNKAAEVEEGPKGKWTEHIWSAWVHPGFSDDLTEEDAITPGGHLLSEFQKDKFVYFFFHVLDLNADNVISSEDFQKLNDRIRHYMDWSVNTVQYLVLKEIHETFLENFLKIASNFSTKKNDGFDYWDPFKSYNEEVEEQEEKTCVTIDEWIDVWGILVGKAKTLSDFPMWLQCYPRVLFDIINRTGSGIISKSELKHFYTAFMDVGKLGEERLEAITQNAFNALTCDGELRLTCHVYKLSFLNFLLGKQPNGPGQYLFGTVTPKKTICSFPIDYSAMNSTEEDREVFGPDKLQKKSRRSVIV